MLDANSPPPELCINAPSCINPLQHRKQPAAMATWLPAFLLVLQVIAASSEEPILEFSTDSPINNVAQDPQTGRVYLGAVNAIYQLNSLLHLEARAETGPKKDARGCTPPVSTCQDLKDTNNTNKLLLVHSANGSLIVCGSLYRGICSLLNLTNVKEQIYYSDSKGERTYATSTEEHVSVVGVMATLEIDNKPFSVFLVGKGYGSMDSSKLISTRIVQNYRDWVLFESIIEASTVQAVPFVPKYLHDFRFAFKNDNFVYFLFSRTLGGTDNKNFTFVSRLCENDNHYYSYTELQLSCGLKNRYNKVQAAYLTEPGKMLAQAISESGDYGNVREWHKVLFVVASSEEGATESALCMYPLKNINQKLLDIVTACYTDNGKINNRLVVESPYTSSKDEPCVKHDKDIVNQYKCGADFLPSPLASRQEFALKANPVFIRQNLLTAVAVAVENDHTVAFLGHNAGEVIKVHLSSHPEAYNPGPGYKTSGYVNKNLFFDKTQAHLYITTEKKITKVPLQACHLKLDCQSCVAQRDPYCGWCVLEGRCTRRSECSRAEEKNGWLWSPNQQCVKIVSFHPPNLSCLKSQQVEINVRSLPILRDSDRILCAFGSYQSNGRMVDGQISCRLPELHLIPLTPAHQDFVAVPVQIFVNGSVQFASSEYKFYNCAAAIRKAENTPCTSCVSSAWGCQWNIAAHTCTDLSDAETGANIIKHRQNKSCPRFENPDPVLIPVGYKTRISFEGINLDPYKGRDFTIGTELMKFEEDVKTEPGPFYSFSGYTFSFDKAHETNVLFHVRDKYMGKKIDSSLSVTLYNCSLGREDCSLCTNADPKYQCVWCTQSSSCVYDQLCASKEPEECPDPQITDITPRFGPLKGGIAVTIKGSNLGIQKDDIKNITVAGVPCKHLRERYSVSTSVVCEIGPAKLYKTGEVEIEVGRGKKGVSTKTVRFTYRFVERSKHKNDTVIMFLSPVVNESQFFRTYVQLDNLQTELTPFEYHPDPTFDRLSKTDITENSMIIVTGRGFSKAMTAKEAQAFVGDAPCNVNTLQDDKLFLDPPSTTPSARSKRQRRDTGSDPLDLVIKFGNGEWLVGSVRYERKYNLPLPIIIPAVVVPMLLIIAISVVCYRRKSQQAEREYEKVKHQLENLEESVRDRCKKEFTDLMIEMEDHTNDISEGRIPFLDYKTYTDRVFFLPSKDGANDVMITGKLDIPESRRATVTQALNQFSNLLNSKTFLINFIRTLEGRPDFNARAKVYFASLLTVALHGKLEYYTDIMRTLLLGLMEDYVHSKNPKLLLRRSETVVERMLSNWMSICLYQFLKDSAGEPLYKLFRAIKHQIEKGPVDAQVKKAKYTLNDTGLLGDDVEYIVLTLQVQVQGEGPDITPVKVLNCDTISQVKEKIIEQVYKNQPHSQRPKVDSVTLEWRPGSTGQILSDLDVTSQKEGRWRRINTLAHYNVCDNATVVLSRVQHTQQSYDQNHDNHEERNALLEDDKVFHLVRPADELDEMKSKRGSIKDKSMTKAITEIYLTRLLSVKGTLQQFVDDFFRSVLSSGASVPPAVKYFFDFLDEQALRHENVDEETIHIWKTNRWERVRVLCCSLIVSSLSRPCLQDSPSNKLLYAKEISTYKRMVDEYYKGIRQIVSVSDQEMNTHLAEVSREHTDKLNTQVALHQLYRYASKYYDGIIMSLDEDPAAQSKQLTLRLQQIAAALENKVTDL
ncbi:plexin-B2-like [Sinocyclocheilus grahami]|uniref:plexin-B2-like n=1 Tax=Sinocyclocheilus grahami TaxID=75366 RepID=UPI0007AD32C9|nr:PREDICTED: plexin-B2-like [Sinocyclocheilus grahami]